MGRVFDYDIMQEIKERWSTRAFSTEKVDKKEIMALLEAARYAPSCFNEQPWRFMLAMEDNDLKLMRSILTEKNQRWAAQAPVLILVMAKRNFILDGKPNRWAQFDAGTAWGYLSLEAQRRGLITHGMGGFDPEAARKKFNIPADHDIIAVVAVGKKGSGQNLPEELRKTEEPGLRKSLKEIVLNVNSFK